MNGKRKMVSVYDKWNISVSFVTQIFHSGQPYILANLLSAIRNFSLHDRYHETGGTYYLNSIIYSKDKVNLCHV